MAITDWPNQERPREKCLHKGVQSLSDAELLAILLRTGRQGQTAIDVARELLQHFQGLKNLFGAELNDIQTRPGLGPAKAVLLQCVNEIGRRISHELLPKRITLSNNDSTKRFLKQQLCHYQHEVFCALLLDCQNRMLNFSELSHGTLDYAQVYPRELVKHIIKHNAKRIIISHNHPSGRAKSSAADLRFTKSLKETLAFLDIELLDHIIVGEQNCFSMVEHGLM